MSKSESRDTNSGLLLGLLGIVFVTLKLLGKITWSWWWVTLPFWGGLALMLAVLLVGGVLAVCVATWETRTAKAKR